MSVTLRVSTALPSAAMVSVAAPAVKIVVHSLKSPNPKPGQVCVVPP